MGGRQVARREQPERRCVSCFQVRADTDTACGGEIAKQIGTNIIFNSDKYAFQFSNQTGDTQLAHSGERAKQVQPVRRCICPQERSEKTQERSEEAYMYVQFHSVQPFVQRIQKVGEQCKNNINTNHT